MKAEYTAVKNRLTAHTILDGAVDDVVRRTDDGNAVQDNYVVLTMSVPEEDTDRFTAVTLSGADREVVFSTQAVAVDVAGVMTFVDAIKSQLLGHRLTVTGRTCTPIRRLPDVEEGEIRYDRTARLFYVHMSWSFWSKRPA